MILQVDESLSLVRMMIVRFDDVLLGNVLLGSLLSLTCLLSKKCWFAFEFPYPLTSKKRISIGLDCLCVIVLLMMPTAHLLSSWMGVSPCWWPSSSSVVRMGMASRVLMKAAPVSASWAEDIMVSITLQVTRIEPLEVGEVDVELTGYLGVSLRKKKPPACDRTFGPLRCIISEWTKGSIACRWLLFSQW